MATSKLSSVNLEQVFQIFNNLLALRTFPIMRRQFFLHSTREVLYIDFQCQAVSQFPNLRKEQIGPFLLAIQPAHLSKRMQERDERDEILRISLEEFLFLREHG